MWKETEVKKKKFGGEYTVTTKKILKSGDDVFLRPMGNEVIHVNIIDEDQARVYIRSPRAKKVWTGNVDPDGIGLSITKTIFGADNAYTIERQTVSAETGSGQHRVEWFDGNALRTEK